MPCLLIDGTTLCRDAKGVGRYAHQLCLQMVARLAPEWHIEIVVFSGPLPDFPADYRANFRCIPYATDLARGLLRMPAIIKSVRPDVYLRCNDSCGLDYGVPMITICHGINDLIVYASHVRRGPVERLVYFIKRHFIRQGLLKSKLVVCNSEFLEKAVHQHYGVEPDNTAVGYCGIDERFYRQAPLVDKASVRRRYGVERFILTFATGDLHEGAERLPAISAEMKVRNIQACLLIGGVNIEAPYVLELRSLFKDKGLIEGRDFIFEKFLDEDHFSSLVELYSAADFYLELSRHESFGMQLAEAMACGTTCISSHVDGLKEVGGPFALPLLETSPRFIADAIADAYRAGMDCRDNLAQIAYTRRFNWDAVGKLVADKIVTLGATEGEGTT